MQMIYYRSMSVQKYFAETKLQLQLNIIFEHGEI